MSVEVEHLRSIVSPVRLACPARPPPEQLGVLAVLGRRRCPQHRRRVPPRDVTARLRAVMPPRRATRHSVLHARRARPSVRPSVRRSDRLGCGETVFVAPAQLSSAPTWGTDGRSDGGRRVDCGAFVQVEVT